MAKHQGRTRGTLDMERVTQETLPKLLARNARDLTDQAATGRRNEVDPIRWTVWRLG